MFSAKVFFSVLAALIVWHILTSEALTEWCRRAVRLHDYVFGLLSDMCAIAGLGFFFLSHREWFSDDRRNIFGWVGSAFIVVSFVVVPVAKVSLRRYFRGRMKPPSKPIELAAFLFSSLPWNFPDEDAAGKR